MKIDIMNCVEAIPQYYINRLNISKVLSIILKLDII